MKNVNTKHLTHFALLEALESEGCALCALVLRSLERYFDGLVYEKVNRPAIRDIVRASRGFCAAHGEMLRQARSALGSAIIHRDIINTLAQRLEAETHQAQTAGDWLRTLVQSNEVEQDTILGGAEPCPACIHARQSEQNYIETLLSNWADVALREAFCSSSGLCVSHLRLTLAQARDPKTFKEIKAAQLAIWHSLLGELDEFIRKQDYRFSKEPLGSERDAPYRALYLVSGMWQVSGSKCR